MRATFFDQINITPFITGAVQAKLNQGNLTRFPFLDAGAKTRSAYDSTVAPWFERIRKNIDEAKTLSQTRDLLLSRLMSGEILLRAAEKEMEAIA